MPPPHSLNYIRNRYLKLRKKSSSSSSKERKESGQQSERRIPGREADSRAGGSSLPPLQGDPLPGLVKSSVSTSAREGSFFYYGEIDEEAVLRIRGSEVTAETVRGRPVITKGAILTGALSTSHPTTNVDIRKGLGRGSVELLEKPARENDYTLVFRVRDDEGGSDQYHIHLTWQE
jgi:hypothetical protein